ncbi:hypothetical protein RB195_023120 [Necator americanus]|uniref:Uncharacterized protein n=1 Tax=Necator americanus TaxID=51031 RepID=A0ABR1EI81_NECAM
MPSTSREPKRGLRGAPQRTASLCQTCFDSAHDKVVSNFEDHQGIVGKKRDFEESVAGGSFEKQAEDTGSSKKKNESEEVPQGPPRL